MNISTSTHPSWMSRPIRAPIFPTHYMVFTTGGVPVGYFPHNPVFHDCGQPDWALRVPARYYIIAVNRHTGVAEYHPAYADHPLWQHPTAGFLPPRELWIVFLADLGGVLL